MIVDSESLPVSAAGVIVDVGSRSGAASGKPKVLLESPLWLSVPMESEAVTEAGHLITGSGR